MEPPSKLRKILSGQAILKAQGAVDGIYVSEHLKDYIVHLVSATRKPKDYQLDKLTALIEYGASPRASLGLTVAAKAHAFLNGTGVRHARGCQGPSGRRDAPPVDPDL